MVEFNYSRLGDLAREARNAAAEADRYAGDLENKIRKPLGNYSGKHTANINTAYERTRVKADRLRQKGNKLKNYSGRVEAFKESVMTAENRLTNRISSLMGSFKKRWNIKEPAWYEKLLEGICDFLGLGDVFDAVRSFLKDVKAYLKHIWEEVKDWYHFRGGAEIIDVVVSVLVAVVLVVIEIVLVVVSGGTWLAVTLGALAAIVACLNAFGKITQYLNTLNQDHVLHMSANNKIASETDFASWLRRQGQYELAFDFQVFEFAVAIANAIHGFGSLLKNAKNVIKTKSGHFFQNVFKSIKEGTQKAFSFKKAWANAETLKRIESVTKVIKNYVNIGNGIYSMIRTNNFGKNAGKALWDTVKAGKDTWDTVINNTLGNAWNFKYWDTWENEEKTQKMSDILNKYLKNAATGTNRLWSANLHDSLSLSNFKYDANINKPTDTKYKWVNTIGSPSKFMHFVMGKIDSDYTVSSGIAKGLNFTGQAIQTGFQFWFAGQHPLLGIPMYAAETL